MKNTTVKLTSGNILDGKEKDAVVTMHHNGQENTSIDGKTIKLVSYKKTDDEVVIVVEVNHARV